MVGKIKIEVNIMGPLLHQCCLFLCRPKKGRKRRKKEDIMNNKFLASICHAQHIWYSFHKTLEPWVATPFNDNMEAWEKSKKQKQNKTK
jgi:hypothetical protein